MPSGFDTLEAYLSHIRTINLTPDMQFNISLTPDSDFHADQKVPQLTTLGFLGEDMMFGDIKAEPTEFSNNYCRSDPFSFGEEGRLPPVGSLTCTPVELTDQQLSADHSPIHLLDLDHTNSELPFYPEPFIKQEFAPMPAGCQDYGYDTQSQDSLIFGEQFQQEAVDNLFNTVQNDIENACATLQIPADPMAWTSDQTRSWVMLILQQYQLPVIEAYLFQMSGAQLCQLTPEEFTKRSPKCGNTLCSQLEIWNNWNTFSQQTSRCKSELAMSGENAYMSYSEVVLPHPTPVVSPAPSSSSLDSLASSSGSSVGFTVHNIQFEYPITAMESETVVKKVRHGEHKQTIHLWQFLKELLLHAQSHGNCIKWLDREKGVFKIEDSSRVATLWGKRKNRPAMNYDKLSRSIRQYYKKGIIKKTEHSKRLVYQFCKPYL